MICTHQTPPKEEEAWKQQNKQGLDVAKKKKEEASHTRVFPIREPSQQRLYFPSPLRRRRVKME
jgi:hypothetical protein